MRLLIQRITNIFIRNGVADEDNRAVISYGLDYKIIHLGVAILIGIMFGRVFDIIVFHIFYQKLRTYAGGHHAKSNIVCFISSCGIAVVTLMFWSLCPGGYQVWCTIGFLAISFPVIWTLSPIGSANKPLDEAETPIYRKKARVLLLIEVSISVLFLLMRVMCCLHKVSLIKLKKVKTGSSQEFISPLMKNAFAIQIRAGAIGNHLRYTELIARKTTETDFENKLYRNVFTPTEKLKSFCVKHQL